MLSRRAGLSATAGLSTYELCTDWNSLSSFTNWPNLVVKDVSSVSSLHIQYSL